MVSFRVHAAVRRFDLGRATNHRRASKGPSSTCRSCPRSNLGFGEQMEVSQWCSVVASGFGFGRSHELRQMPTGHVVASCFPQGGRPAMTTVRRGRQSAILTSVRSAVAPHRTGAVAVRRGVALCCLAYLQGFVFLGLLSERVSPASVRVSRPDRPKRNTERRAVKF